MAEKEDCRWHDYGRQQFLEASRDGRQQKREEDEGTGREEKVKMGNKNSRETSPSIRTDSGHPPSTSATYIPMHHHAPLPAEKRLDRRYSRIADDYETLDQVTMALAEAGLESSNLIVGIDFTKSNEWSGTKSFNKRSLHDIGVVQNPYEQAISIIGKTLSSFDEDNLIPCFGFGDASRHDQNVFSFYPDSNPCEGFEDVLKRYREITPQLRLSGPTSFAPIIEMATTIVEESGGQYHVLLILADGQVTRTGDNEFGQLSSQERNTIDAIVKASNYPLSIILVGVGDGPWDMMEEFDDNIPSRDFDNFQISVRNAFQRYLRQIWSLWRHNPTRCKLTAPYSSLSEETIAGEDEVAGISPEKMKWPDYRLSWSKKGYIFVNFTDTMSQKVDPLKKQTEFALTALMEIPSQYKTTLKLNLLGIRTGYCPNTVPLPPPYGGNLQILHPYSLTETASPSDNKMCALCLSNPKYMAFGCGHQTCCNCGLDLLSCPICQDLINTKIRLYQ
ncbi:hypothetical protein LXL04_011628 [Taraxacum kok-saghyz]